MSLYFDSATGGGALDEQHRSHRGHDLEVERGPNSQVRVQCLLHVDDCDLVHLARLQEIVAVRVPQAGHGEAAHSQHDRLVIVGIPDEGLPRCQVDRGSPGGVGDMEGDLVYPAVFVRVLGNDGPSQLGRSSRFQKSCHDGRLGLVGAEQAGGQRGERKDGRHHDECDQDDRGLKARDPSFPSHGTSQESIVTAHRSLPPAAGGPRIGTSAFALHHLVSAARVGEASWWRRTPSRESHHPLSLSHHSTGLGLHERLWERASRRVAFHAMRRVAGHRPSHG